MKDSARCLYVTAVVVLCAATMGYARFPGFSGESHQGKKGDVTLAEPARLANGPELKAGDYQVAVSREGAQSMVNFFQNDKLIAQAPAKLVATGQKIDETAVDLNEPSGPPGEITAVELQGWHQKIVLENSNGSSQSGS